MNASQLCLSQNPSTVDNATLINNDNTAALGSAAYDWAKACSCPLVGTLNTHSWIHVAWRLICKVVHTHHMFIWLVPFDRPVGLLFAAVFFCIMALRP